MVDRIITQGLAQITFLAWLGVARLLFGTVPDPYGVIIRWLAGG